MKKILLTLGAFALTYGVTAQTYLYDTFDDFGAGWTVTDGDGDGYKWEFLDVGDPVGVVATSASWINNPLTPNNYVFSPAITLGTTNLSLSYKVAAFNPQYSQEHYAVYVTTVNTAAAVNAATPVFEETLPANSSAILTRTVDLSAFSGQTVYVTFRHYNVTDMLRMLIDDVLVGEMPAYEVKLVDSKIPSGVTPGNFNITGTVKNYGAQPITTLTVSYDAGAGAVSSDLTVNIAAGATYTFTHPTPLVTTAGESYTLDICATVANDANTNNNCVTGGIDYVVVPSVDKYVVTEEKTGTWCQYCPYGNAAMSVLEANEPLSIGIAVHNQDPMAVASYDQATEALPDFDGYPYAATDRMIGRHAANMAQGFGERENFPAPASIGFTLAQYNAGGTITVTPAVEMVTNLSGDFRVAVVLVEDEVKGTGNSWLQVNAINQVGQAIEFTGEDWATLGNPVNVVNVFGGYDHVARALGNNAFNGSAGSLPATLVSGQTYDDYSYTFNVGSTWNVYKMHAVAMLIKNSTGEILNAGETAIDANGLGVNEVVAENFSVGAYPNPTNGLANINISLKDNSEVALVVYDMVGGIVHSTAKTTLAAGEHTHVVDFSSLAGGIYIAQVTVNGTTQKIKINVAK